MAVFLWFLDDSLVWLRHDASLQVTPPTSTLWQPQLVSDIASGFADGHDAAVLQAMRPGSAMAPTSCCSVHTLEAEDAAINAMNDVQ